MQRMTLIELANAQVAVVRNCDYSSHVKTAAVARLKAELSRYLRFVKSGEEILVTERRVPVARLVPIEPADLVDDGLREMERQGLVRIGSGKLPRGFWKQRRARDRTGLLRKAMTKERESGW
jgi:prevent-host-death family protein